MRLNEVPGYGIGLFKDGIVVFIPDTNPGSIQKCIRFHPHYHGGTFFHLPPKGCMVGCYKETDTLERFWQMSPEEVEKLEPIIRKRLEEGK